MGAEGTAVEPTETDTPETRFLSGLTHELRTPLGSILMLAELLGGNRSGTLGAKDLKYVDKIQQAALDVRGLIDEAGSLNRINAGRVRPSATEVSTRALARRLEQSQRPAAEKKQLRLTVSLEDDLAETVVVDGRLLERILGILVENAIRTTASGKVMIELGRPAAGNLEIRVRDGAPAVPEDQCRAIFEPFGHTGPQTRRKLGGQSLALPIARRLSRLLGGDLELTSSGRGNTFVLSLPVEGGT